MSKLQDPVDRAHQMHQSGRIQEAIDLYLKVLRKQPRNAQLLFLLGTAYLQTGQFTKSIGSLQNAVLLNPKNAAAHCNLGVSLNAVQRFDEALSHFGRAVLIKPDYAEAYNNRGSTLIGLKRPEDALTNFDQALAIKPDYAEAHNNRGLVLKDLNRLEEALASYDKVLAIAPAHAQAHHNRGLVLVALKHLHEALASFEQSLAIKPDYAEAYNNRGNLLRELNRLEEALASYDQAIQLKPDYAEAHYNRGVVLGDLEQPEQALASYDRALKANPSYAEAYSNRGAVLYNLKRPEQALASYDQAVTVRPNYADAYYNRGVTLENLRQLDQALASYDRALEIDPHHVMAHNNRGVILYKSLDLERAMASYDRALQIDPNIVEAYWNKSLVLLLTSKFAEGWELYEWRLKRGEALKELRTFPQPSWRGQMDIQGKRLLIQCEQGFGDVVQFCRYLPQVKALGAEIILEVPESLTQLVATMHCPITVVTRGAPLPEFDAYCPLLSLPYVLKTTPETIPANIPYLFSDQNKVRQWQDRLGHESRLRVGLVWSGSESHENDKNRSIALEDLLPLMSSSVEWHSLQKAYRQQDLSVLGQHPEIRQHQDDLHDFSDTAALIECLDLVISVDTSVVHVAGAIGKPTWVLLPYCPDFRWMLDRTDSPWYPTARLFRQPKREDWQSVIHQVQRELAELVAKSHDGCAQQ